MDRPALCQSERPARPWLQRKKAGAIQHSTSRLIVDLTIGDATHTSQIEDSSRQRHRRERALRRQPYDFSRSGWACRLLPYEKILVGNLSNGERFETYVIYGEARRGIIELNGATAHLGKIGDRITIMSFARYTPEEAAVHQPRILVLNEKNEIVRYEGGASEPALKVVGE